MSHSKTCPRLPSRSPRPAPRSWWAVVGLLSFLLLPVLSHAHEVVVVPKQASGGGMLVTVTPTDHLEFSTRSIDLGVVALADTAGAWVDVTNVSSRTLEVGVAIEPAALAESGELGISTDTLTLAPGEEQRILITFRPQGTQTYAMDLVFSVAHDGVRRAHVETLSGAGVGSGTGIAAEGTFAFADGSAFSRTSDERFCVDKREDFPTYSATPASRRKVSSRFNTEVNGLIYASEWGHLRHTHFWVTDFSATCVCDTSCNLTATGSWTEEALPIEGGFFEEDFEFPHRPASAVMRESGTVNSNGARRWAQGVMAVGAVECDRLANGELQCADTSLKISSGIKLGSDEIGGEVSLGADWTIKPDRRSDIQELFAEVQCLPCVRAYNVAAKVTGLAEGDTAPLTIKMSATGPNVQGTLTEEVQVNPQGEGDDDARVFSKRIPNRSTVTLTTTDPRCPNTVASNVVSDGDLELDFRCGGHTVDAKLEVQGELGVGNAQVKLTTILGSTREQSLNVDKTGDFKFPSTVPKGSEWTVELGQQTCVQCTITATPSLTGNNLTRDLQVTLQCEENLSESCGAEVSTALNNDKVASAEATLTATLEDGTSLPPEEMSLSSTPQVWPTRLPTGTSFTIKVTSAESNDFANPEVECQDFSATISNGQDRIAANIDCEVLGGDPNDDRDGEGGGETGDGDDEDIEQVDPTIFDCIWDPQRCGGGGSNCKLRRQIVETHDPQTNTTTITTTFYWDCTGGELSIYPWGGTPDFEPTTLVWTWTGPEVVLGVPQEPLEGQVQLAGSVTSTHEITRLVVSIDGQPTENVTFDGTDFTVDIDTTELGDGLHAIAVLAWNDAPMYTYPGFAFSVDNSPQPPAECVDDTSYPTLEVEPTHGLKLAPGTVTISGTASDPSGLEGITVWVDNVETASFTSSPFSLDTNLALGDHTIVVVANDVCGKLTQRTSVVEVTDEPLDCEPGVDTLVWTSPSGGEGPFLEGQPVTLGASASDVDGIDRVEIWAGGTLVDTLTSAPYQTSWIAQAGTDEVGAVAYDTCGHSDSVMAPITVVEDVCDGGVTTTLLSPAHGDQLTLGNSFALSASASDAQGISKVQFYKTIAGNDILIGEDTTADPPGSPFGPYWMTWSPGAGDLGVTAIKARAFSTCEGGATDSASDSHAISVTDPNACDGSIDWVSFVSPSNWAVLEAGTPVSVTAQAGDAEGLSVLRFYKVQGGSEIQIGEVPAGLAPIQPVGFTWTPGPGDVGISELRVRAFSSCGDGLTDSDWVGRSVSVIDSQACDGVVDSIQLTSPADQQQLFRGSLVTLAAQANDAQGISRIQFWKTLDGGEQLIAERIGDDVTYNWIPQTADLGVTAITARAFSACGDGLSDTRDDSHAVTVIEGCDGVVDSVDLISPTTGSQLTVGVPTTLQATASDGQGIASIRFYRVIGGSEFFIGLSTGSPASISWTPTSGDLDATAILARAYSACGTGFDDVRDEVNAVTVVDP